MSSPKPLTRVPRKHELTQRFNSWGWRKRSKYRRRDQNNSPTSNTGSPITPTRQPSRRFKVGRRRRPSSSQAPLSPCLEEQEAPSPLLGLESAAGLALRVTVPSQPDLGLPAVIEEDAPKLAAAVYIESQSIPPETQSLYSVSHASSYRYTDNPLQSLGGTSWGDDKDITNTSYTQDTASIDIVFGPPLSPMRPIGFEKQDISDMGSSFDPPLPENPRKTPPLSIVRERIAQNQRHSDASPMEGFLGGQQLTDRLYAGETAAPIVTVDDLTDWMQEFSSEDSDGTG